MTQDTGILFFHGVSDLLRKLVHRHGDVILSIKNYLGTKGCLQKAPVHRTESATTQVILTINI